MPRSDSRRIASRLQSHWQHDVNLAKGNDGKGLASH